MVHNFTALPNTLGSNPAAGLVQGSDGYLYGATGNGGAGGFGTIFRVKTNGSSFSVVHNFLETDGAAPYSTPLLHTNGKIYGLTEVGGTSDNGVMYAVDENLFPFVSAFVIRSGKVGTSVGIVGQDFLSATGVLFGTGAGTFAAAGDSFMTAKVVAGATTGTVTVEEPGGNLLSLQPFKVTPSITSFSPASGPVGTPAVIKGMSLLQTTAVKFGGVVATVFSVDSTTQVTATVPSGAVTGKISITTPGGTANSPTNFTVN